MTDDLKWLTAVELLDGYRGGRLSPVEVTRAALGRIEAVDGKLNSLCLVDAEAALDQARASEKRWREGNPAGAVDGVPTLIKDILVTKGWPTLRGSRTADPAGPSNDDAPGVARLREHGAVFLGKTTTPEFGWKDVTDSPLTGVTRNPWDMSKTPGGSSGGSSAAVAAGIAPLSLGTDGGGSIRIPAGFSGIFGHKPSFGRVPAWPLSPFGTVSHAGPMTRTVEDSALMLNVIAEPDARDWHALPYDGADYRGELRGGVSGLKIAYSANLGYVDSDPEIAGLVASAVRAPADLGAHVDEVDPGFADHADTFRTIWWTGAYALLGKLDGQKRELLDPDLAHVVEEARSITLEDALEATAARGRGTCVSSWSNTTFSSRRVSP